MYVYYVNSRNREKERATVRCLLHRRYLEIFFILVGKKNVDDFKPILKFPRVDREFFLIRFLYYFVLLQKVLFETIKIKKRDP